MPSYYGLMLLLVGLMPYCMMAYPVFGTKRYGRSSSPVHNSWGMSSLVHVPTYYYQSIPRLQNHYPITYYEAMNPYAPDYVDDYYYPQEALSYPLYYSPLTKSNSKYEFYQPAIPYYYSDRHLAKPDYNYYDAADPVDDLEEEIHQEEREEREDALPIGQETWYETDNNPEADESLDDVNAAFLQNLMVYNSALNTQKYDHEKQPVDSYSPQSKDYSDEYANWNINNLSKSYPSEDEDVMELKMLAEKPKKQKSKTNQKHTTAQERLQMFEKNKNLKMPNYDPNNSEAWINWDNKRSSINKQTLEPVMDFGFTKPDYKQYKYFEVKDKSFNVRKPQITVTPKPISSSTPSTFSNEISTEKPARDARGGQKEVVLMRPATPVRRPFSEPVMELLAQQGGPERKRSPSVYDTIKHLLEMEKNLEENYRQQNQLRPPMRKRYVSNEESLVEELSGLKKTA